MIVDGRSVRWLVSRTGPYRSHHLDINREISLRRNVFSHIQIHRIELYFSHIHTSIALHSTPFQQF